MQDLPWHNIWSADNPVELLNDHLLLLVGRFVPTKIIRVRNKDELWIDDQWRHVFGLKQQAQLRWTRDRSQVNGEEFVRCQMRANETCSKASELVQCEEETGMYYQLCRFSYKLVIFFLYKFLKLFILPKKDALFKKFIQIFFPKRYNRAYVYMY